jgi:hypothetical protein
MNRVQCCLAVVAGLGGTLLALTAGAPAALATIPDPGGGPAPGLQPAIPAVVVGGMPGWQITLIALGAALLAATLAVLLDGTRRARRRATAA